MTWAVVVAGSTRESMASNRPMRAIPEVVACLESVTQRAVLAPVEEHVAVKEGISIRLPPS